MAPGRSSARRSAHGPQAPTSGQHAQDENLVANKELFIDPMLGTALAIYIEKDVEDKETISDLIVKHGGTVSPGYSGVSYILVDPHKPSGQNLYRLYASKKTKIILNAIWVHECIKANQLQTFHVNWAGCKVTGNESLHQSAGTSRRPEEPPSRPVQSVHPQALQAAIPPVEPMQPYQFHMYTPMQGPAPRPPAWQVAVTPAQAHLHPPSSSSTHMMPPRSGPPHTHSSHQYRDDAWEGYNPPPAEDITPPNPPYDYRYRDDHSGWVSGPGPYYEPSYDHSYAQSYMGGPAAEHSSNSNSVVGQNLHLAPGPSSAPSASTESPEKPRGRKRTRTQPPPAVPASSLVVNRNPPARSPTPPTRVIKSTYGGNLFTSDDVIYLKKYIDYCQNQCLVLSLREICERIAVKAPHHTFYSWRRYCNKHQIRLGGYTMAHDRSASPHIGDDLNIEMEEDAMPGIQSDLEVGGSSSRVPNVANPARDSPMQRDRSPTPPRALFRSTTGKGVAFTQEDVTFLVRLMEYRKSQGSLDMVAFWKDVALKAPHHSRASWMKFWRRHKHELNRSEGDEPLPVPPDKKMRYSKEDDILLAKYFFNKPDGTSDKIFQAFGRLHPHHPWKGWQEHHRIHKNKIEHLIELLAAGESLDSNTDQQEDMDIDES